MQSMPTKLDCSDAAVNTTTLVPNGISLTAAPGTAAGPWDQFRRQLDPSGFITKLMALQYSPLPNNWEVGDGLNTAGYRILRHYTGLDNLFGSGEATGNRKQYNVKIDHNFNARHKANVNFTYERVVSDDVLAPFPAGMSDSNFRHPIVISAGFVSTLSPTFLNEARFGYRLQDLNVIAPMELPQYQSQLKALLPAPINGIKILPFFGFGQTPGNVPCPAYYGSRPGSNAPLPGTASTCNIAPTSKGKTPTWTYADTVQLDSQKPFCPVQWRVSVQQQLDHHSRHIGLYRHIDVHCRDDRWVRNYNAWHDRAERFFGQQQSPDYRSE
jgi:hypothetical protein